jgi:hypothetical protein
VRDGKLSAEFLFCSLDREKGFGELYDRRVTLTFKELFGEVPSKTWQDQPVEASWRNTYGPPVIKLDAGGVASPLIVGNAIYVPYFVECSSFYGQHQAGGSGPKQSGVLYSAGDHSRWTRIKLFDAPTISHGVVATRSNVYFFAQRLGELNKKVWGLWCVRLTEIGEAQTQPELLAPTYCTTSAATYSAIPEDGKVHLIWLDQRHETYSARQVIRSRGGPGGAMRYEVYYRNRSDDGTWRPELHLSKGVPFAFAPVMAVEGDNIVVAWAGYKKGWGEFSPSDIYFTTSADSGHTWTAPARATDNAKLGLITGRPQVALKHGMIHLFYSQGKIRENPVGAGLSLLNQPPWDIMHQKRSL